MEATGGAGDVPIATLDRRMMTHTTKISEAPHSALPHHALVSSVVCVCACVLHALALLDVSDLPFSVHYGTVCSSVQMYLCVCMKRK